MRGVQVCRPKIVRPDSPRAFAAKLTGARFVGVSRRGKHLLFELRMLNSPKPLFLMGHLGMTGRMYLLPPQSPLPKHAAVVMDLGPRRFVFEDTRYFGRLTFDRRVLARLGPEPLSVRFTPESFWSSLKHSRQAIKVKLLDQRLVAGIGNIYASEALFRAGISPLKRCCGLSQSQAARLWRAIRHVLRQAISCGSTVPLNFAGAEASADRLFYFGTQPGMIDYYEERLRVYDRAGHPCPRCRAPIRRLAQAARSTFYCPRCQRR